MRIHLTLRQKGPADTAVVCATYESEHRYSEDCGEANCKQCLQTMADFIRDISSVEACYNGDDSRRLEYWAERALRLVEGES